MNAKMKLGLSQKAAKAAVILSLLVLPSLVTSCRPSVESDTKLTDTFLRKAGYINKILAMTSQDRRIQRIDFDFVTLDTGALWKEGDPEFSEQRWDEYRALFREVGLQYGVGRQNGAYPVVFFYARCNGSAITRDCKGYAYSEKALAPTKNDLNQLAPGLFYKQLDRDWYLFRDGG